MNPHNQIHHTMHRFTTERRFIPICRTTEQLRNKKERMKEKKTTATMTLMLSIQSTHVQTKEKGGGN